MADDRTKDKDLGKRGVADQVKGKANQAAGKVQKKAGEATGNQEAQVKGAAREVRGKVEEKGGQAKKKVDDNLDRDRTM
ncbi:MAG TPA: CsbD family protein [Ktedonobacteraceae bacterium]